MHLHHSIGPRLRPAAAFLTLVLGSATLIALIGCGAGGGSSVSGKVTHKNEPVKGGSLTFVPIAEGAAEAGKPAAAEVADDGTYRASVSPGMNKVSYSAPVA